MSIKSRFQIYKVWMGRWIVREDMEGLGFDKSYWRTSRSYIGSDQSLHFTTLKAAIDAMRLLQLSNNNLGLNTEGFAVVKFNLTDVGFVEESRKEFCCCNPKDSQ